MGNPIEGFFDKADAVAKAMASSAAAAEQGAPAETLVLSSEPIPTEKSTQAERVVSSESASIPAKIPTPQKEVTPTGASQTESTSPLTPLVISAIDPFLALSQAVKNGSSLVVTQSSIPSSATRGPDADLSSNEGSDEVFEDSKDEPVIKTIVFYSDEDNIGGEQEVEAMGMCISSLVNLLFFLFLPFPNISL